MTDHHVGRRTGCFVYAMLPGFASVCAPKGADVLAYMEAFAPPAPGWRWALVDRGVERPNPNPCNQDAHRGHYFLWLEEV